MDPNETLAEIRRLGTRLIEEPSDNATFGLLAGALVAHIEALDGWLSKGGFLPTSWDVPR